MSPTALSRQTPSPDKVTPEGWEIFCDPCYYDMWAVRPVGCRSFTETKHFPTRSEAIAFAEQGGGAAI